jgi:RNA polymerase sigma factor (sigma-70 family)
MSEVALPIAHVPRDPVLPGRLCSDERLARLASAGSERALAVLYERHHQALYRYCRSILRDHDDAQDALQSTMTRAFAALQGSDRDLAVRPWLFRIAHNEAISILRQRRPNDCVVDEHLPSEVSVERTVDQRERLQLLVADLNALPVRQRAALLMRELSGLPIEEIAAALSVSTGVAKQTVFEARSALHELAEGRTMECETVRRAISDGDRRVLRGRRIGSHLRGCAGCRDFRALIDTRTADLRALAPPLPASVAAAMLARVLGRGAAGGHAGGAAAAGGAAMGNHAAASLVVKGLVGAAVMAAATAGTLHLTRGPAKHKHTPTVVAPVKVERTASVGRASRTTGSTPSAVVVARLSAARVRGHAPGVRRTDASATITSSKVAVALAPAQTQPAGGQGKPSAQHVHGRATGNPHPASGGGGRGWHKGQVGAHEPRHSHRSHRSSKPTTGPASPSQPQDPSHTGKPRGSSHEGSPRRGGGGNGHTLQGHQTPVGQQPASAEKGNEVHQPTEPPGTPPEKQHGASGR